MVAKLALSVARQAAATARKAVGTRGSTAKAATTTGSTTKATKAAPTKKTATKASAKTATKAAPAKKTVTKAAPAKKAVTKAAPTKKAVTKAARFDAGRGVIAVWLSPNMFGERPCRSMAEARRIVAFTGIKQAIVREDA